MAFCKFVQTYKMQRLLLIILTSIFLITSCQKTTPEGILPESTMVEMMTEVHLVDGYLSTLSIDSSRKVINSLYGRIFDKYQLDSVGFQRNVDFYLGNPTLSKKLYSTINQSITNKDIEFRRADSTIQATLNDSIQRVQYYTKLAEESRTLILNAKKDTLPLSFERYHQNFMSRVGINVRVDSIRRTGVTPSSKIAVPKKAGTITKKEVTSRAPSSSQPPALIEKTLDAATEN